MDDTARPAFYAAAGGGWRDWWTLLHPPYTAWHLSYVVIGAALATKPHPANLVASVAAFFLAVGLAAHALDELHGRPLRTRISRRSLIVTASAGTAGALGLGVAGLARVGVVLVPFMVSGTALLAAYNLELAHGRLHSDVWFALGWGAFPVLTGCVAQDGALTAPAGIAAVAAFGLSAAQRALSNRARGLRRDAEAVSGEIRLRGGAAESITQASLLAPLEGALQSMSWSICLLAAALAVARLR